MSAPLAERLRPRTIEEYIGQEHLVGKNGVFRKFFETGNVPSFILWGPPGVGKTTLAKIVATQLERPFFTLSAVTSGVKEVREVIESARKQQFFDRKPPFLFIDEIHRFNKSQQDSLLGAVEQGVVTLIGATTENPYITINPAIRSRTQIFEVKPLTEEDIAQAINRALTDKENGLGEQNVVLTDEARLHLTRVTHGDLRSALNGLELAVMSTAPDDLGVITIDLQTIEECVQRKALVQDKDGDAHYDVISAFQKSIRGSDTDAALHYMARLLEAGDLPSVIRRLLTIAYEDIGLANPNACSHAVQAITAAEKIGLPEARIPLAQAVIELCLSPKSNSAIMAIDAALADVRAGNYGDVPDHLRDAHYQGAKKLGRGIGYKYPHDYPHGWVKQQYLPDKLKNKHYY